MIAYPQPGEEPCPLDPWIAVPDKSKYVDLQTLKLQENPEVSCYSSLMQVAESKQSYVSVFCSCLVVNMTDSELLLSGCSNW